MSETNTAASDIPSGSQPSDRLARKNSVVSFWRALQ
jgi:hypothetical protein